MKLSLIVSAVLVLAFFAYESEAQFGVPGIMPPVSIMPPIVPPFFPPMFPPFFGGFFPRFFGFPFFGMGGGWGRGGFGGRGGWGHGGRGGRGRRSDESELLNESDKIYLKNLFKCNCMFCFI